MKQRDFLQRLTRHKDIGLIRECNEMLQRDVAKCPGVLGQGQLMLHSSRDEVLLPTIQSTGSCKDVHAVAVIQNSLLMLNRFTRYSEMVAHWSGEVKEDTWRLLCHPSPRVLQPSLPLYQLSNGSS